jgi:hypothetical protein
MPYRYALQDLDDSDLSGGRVLYSLPGQTAFPVRLASEVFLRCLALAKIPPGQKIALYDPLCGGAYHLTALAFRHWDSIESILVSDIRPEAVDLAKRNLSLLSQAGMVKRIEQIEENLQLYGKASHQSALESAKRLQNVLMDHIHQPIHTVIFQADALDPEAIRSGLSGKSARFVMSDLPYGKQSQWIIDRSLNAPLTVTETESETTAETCLLERLRSVLSSGTVIALASTKHTKISHPAFRRIDQFKIGKRKMTFLEFEEYHS